MSTISIITRAAGKSDEADQQDALARLAFSKAAPPALRDPPSAGPIPAPAGSRLNVG